MTNWLDRRQPFDAVFANNDEMAIGAIQAMKAAGVDMKDVVVGRRRRDPGRARGDAGGRPRRDRVPGCGTGQAPGAVDAALKLAKGEAVDQKVYIPFELVTPANAADYMAQN